ncbi:hypothetical protein NDU88_001425 [Pleurodeles waltl]|uniref:Uncharacterized protein n=1 Tax=Pleurodeles waltl TaxID=8319 RepID=A0AAV7V7S2_PLEWA|nr:hypothetical protein NDU88_001425 [Pleurodeles waltl]
MAREHGPQHTTEQLLLRLRARANKHATSRGRKETTDVRRERRLRQAAFHQNSPELFSAVMVYPVLLNNGEQFHYNICCYF